MKKEDFLNTYKDIKKRYMEVSKNIDLDVLAIEQNKYERISLEEGFWDDSDNAKKILKKISTIKKEINESKVLIDLFSEISDYTELIELGEDLTSESIESLEEFSILLDQFEVKKMLNGENDHLGAILSIHPGAGGTESQDWANMLFRMYKRWCEKNDYKYKIIDYQDSEEGGLKEVTIEIDENYLYGLLRSESGVHRLVRISPFDSNSRRHTSFAAVFIFPIIDENIEIDIGDKDIRVDTYRASGAGGQHVNKTDSAVRLTHIETGIVVQCQNQRSQLKNKQTALKLLKSKLFQYQLEKKNANLNDISSNKKSIEWGSQIRSYVFHPYTLVKDHRTNYETSNINLIMDGKIDSFIRSYLLKRMES